MKTGYWIGAGIAALVAVAAPGVAQQRTGAIASDFKLNDSDGGVVQLSQFRGRPVILEWHNLDCPFVRKHYDSGNMQRTQQRARELGAVWLTINSSAPGKQGHLTAAQAKALVAGEKAAPTAYLLDPRGIVGKGYDAVTTPHMYIIDAGGRLVYQGAIDDKPTADEADIATARNHVVAALEEIEAGGAVSVAESRPYGCSVKYPDAD